MFLRASASKLVKPSSRSMSMLSWMSYPNADKVVHETWPSNYIKKARELDPHFDPHNLPIVRTKQGAIVVNNVAWTLEWILSSPPPLHSFLEPPIIVEWPEGEEGHH